MHFTHSGTGLILAGVLYLSMAVTTGADHPVRARSKFEPEDRKVILFTGQELEAIGGMDGYKDGYFDHYPAPGGFTQYTSLLGKQDDLSGKQDDQGKPGRWDKKHDVQSDLMGLTNLADWGDGPESMAITTEAPALKNSCLAIGLDISQGNDSITMVGGHDRSIIRLGSWIKALGRRPVFLRVGYEFDGWDWNHYRKEFYKPAFRRVRHLLDSMGVRNVAYVWQSKGQGTTRTVLDAFYPGDDVVDWVAYSYFVPADSSHPMLQFARDHRKPLFIAESSTVFLDSAGVSRPLDLAKQADAEWAWRDWFAPYFRTIHRYPDIIKAVHYINSPWKYRPLWKDNIYFKNVDARITRNDSLKSWWLRETEQGCYLKASDTLFRYLWGTGPAQPGF